MAKPEWGLKRQCLSCGAKFYDMQRDPIICPSCETVFDPEAAVKLKRGRSAPPDDKAKKEAAAPAEAESDDLDDSLEDDETDEGVLEDTSDLEDDDDVPIVGSGGGEDGEE